jgi:mannose-6-phosphate isomerase-like protein (cupin superfamily)
MDRLQQGEILGRLFSAESRVLEHSKSPDTVGPRSWDHWSAPVLLERVAYLRKLARFGDGTANEELRAFPGHSAMLSVRLRSGTVETSEEFAQLFIVLEGRATMIRGDQIGDSAISGGCRQELRAGDVVHIAAGTPYEIMLTGDKTLSCLVIRIKETEEF